jgi:MFS transporter, DHA2 family, methylenomycin A resistance protein
VAEPQRVLNAALLHVPHPHPGRLLREEPGRLRPGAVLLTSCAGLFLIGVNTTAINTALNAIAEQLQMGSSELSWAVGIYMLAVAAFVVLGGRLGDLLGERVAFSIGLVTFSIGALLVAVAQDDWMVILGRMVQGMGSAVLMPATMATLRIAFPADRQGYALGIWGATGGVAFALGPLIGGALTDELSWRWVWWGSLLYAGALGAFSLRSLGGMPRPAERPSIDYAGVALLAVSLFSLILALQEGPDWGWGSVPGIAAFAVAVAAGLALIVFELRTDEPLLHLRLLRRPALIGANVGTFANTIFLIGVIYFFNLYAQAVVTLDYSAVLASVALLPFGGSMFLASLLVGRVADRIGFRAPVALGLALLGVGGLLLSRVDASSGYGDIWWGILIVGIGTGITFSAPSAAGLRALPAENAGEASGIINVVRYVSAALVISLGTILFTEVGSDELNRSLSAAGVKELERDRLDHVLTGAPSQVTAAEESLGRDVREEFESGAAEGISRGFAAVMLGMALTALASMVAWLVLMRPSRGP